MKAIWGKFIIGLILLAILSNSMFVMCASAQPPPPDYQKVEEFEADVLFEKGFDLGT